MANHTLTTTQLPISGGASCRKSRRCSCRYCLAREMGVLKLETVALDSTRIHANASCHSTLSYEHAGKI